MTTAPTVLSQADIEAVAAALSCAVETGAPDPLLKALDQIAQQALGHRLFTALRYDLAAGVAHRIYSSAPDIYPATGSKTIGTAPALRKMVASGKPLLTPDAEAVRENFLDANAIFGLGCESVLNIPVYGRGRLLGQINLLHRAHHYAPAHLPFCLSLAVAGASAFME